MIKLLGTPTSDDLLGMDIPSLHSTSLQSCGDSDLSKLLFNSKHAVNGSGVASVVEVNSAWSNSFRKDVGELLEGILRFNPEKRFSAGSVLQLDIFTCVRKLE